MQAARAGDQPAAIEALAEGVNVGERFQTLLGITGSGKSATIRILLGLLREGNGLAAVVLTEAGVDIDDLRRRVDAALREAA